MNFKKYKTAKEPPERSKKTSEMVSKELKGILAIILLNNISKSSHPTPIESTKSNIFKIRALDSDENLKLSLGI